MRRADVIKLSIIFFLIFIICLLEFYPQETQVQFLCETVDPCTPKNRSGDVLVCGLANLPCTTEIINGRSQDEPTDWYVCKREMDSDVLHDNTSVSGEHVMVVLTLKGYNLSEWNVSRFTFLNHTDLYTGPQNHQRHFYCLLPPNKSKCPDITMSTEEPPKENSNPPITFQLTTTASPKPVTSSFKKTTLSFKEMSYTEKLNCQPGSNHFIHYQENNPFPRTQTKKESWWCVTTAVWLFLILTLLIVAITSVGARITKSRRIHKKKSKLVVVSPRDYQLKEINEHRGNLRNSASDVFVTVCSENENLLKMNVPFKRPLSPINEITENSLDEDHKEEEEEEEQNSLETKQEFTESHGHLQTSAHLHHHSNPSCSCHETDGVL